MKNMKNLTPHIIRIYRGDDVLIEFPPEGPPVRAVQAPTKVIGRDPRGFDVVEPPRFIDVKGMPEEEEEEGAIIVSMIAAQAILNQGEWGGEVYTPDHSPSSSVRDSDGAILGVRRLVRWQ